MKFKRFTKPQFLKGVGRTLLTRLFDKFSADLGAKKVELPKPDSGDDEYFKSLAAVAMKPDGLPDNLIEALFAMEEMANDEGTERLQAAAEQAGLALSFDAKSSHGDVVMQVYLAKPELLAEKHNEMRLLRLSSFEYFGNKEPKDCSATFTPPGENILALLVKDGDAWFKEHNRGHENTQIQVYLINGEIWFLIRHGDTFARAAKLEQRKLEVIHFRPAKDDVVVYSPKRDELRIHAGTKGERELYRTAFGQRLKGDANYFLLRKAFTLEPLRELGIDALDVTGITGIDRIVLRELEIGFHNGFHESVIRRSDDIFAAAEARGKEAIPAGGRLIRAAFDVYFTGCKKARTVHVRPPNVLKLGRHCDAALINEWFTLRGFRVGMSDGELGLFTAAA
ncbi:MAG TPA: hypothetical protein VK530_17660 [Candidatus Acidoferrum sp.]|nr:hypothetical protein [Candidatus Acidoferrum sp.]